MCSHGTIFVPWAFAFVILNLRLQLKRDQDEFGAIGKMHHPLYESIIQLAGLGVSIIGLIFLVIYVKATKGIEKASNEQSEGLSKPVVTVKLKPALDDDAILWESSSQIPEGDLVFVNIGNGPALEVHWQRDQHATQFLTPYLRPGAESSAAANPVSWTIGHNRWSVVCRYEGISGAQYESSMTFEGKLAKAFSAGRTGR